MNAISAARHLPKTSVMIHSNNHQEIIWDVLILMVVVLKHRDAECIFFAASNKPGSILQHEVTDSQ